MAATEFTKEEKASMALRLVCRCWPYLAPAALRLRVRWDERCGRAACDKHWRLYLAPSWVDETPVQMVALVIAAHELNHLLNSHFKRFRGLNPELSNVATDLSINHRFKEYCDAAKALEQATRGPSGLHVEFEPPAMKDMVHPKQFGWPEDLLAEDYYARLLETARVVKVKCPCGSGATGTPEPYEEEGGEDAVGEAEAEVIARTVAAEIAAEAARGRGTVPGSLERWANVTLAPPKIDWRQKLRAAVRAAAQRKPGGFDYTWQRPNRRHRGPVLFPTTIDYQPSVACLIDTSGSMSSEDHRKAIVEIAGVVQAVGGNLPVVACDAAVHGVVRLKNRQDAATMPLPGGGGTDMPEGIQYAMTLKPRPTLLVVTTDGDTCWDEHGPANCSVLIALTRGPRKTPDWADAVVLDDY